MNLPQQSPYSNTTKGFTLVELVIVIAMLGTLSAYAAMTRVSPSEMSLTSQAQTLASDIRRVQTLAYTSGKRMRLGITTGANGTYTALTCTLTVAPPAPASSSAASPPAPPALSALPCNKA
jgi:MSHA pilin protein MshC